MKNSLQILIVVLLITSCDYFTKKEGINPIARVNESYLYVDDIKDLITESTNSVDSTLIVPDPSDKAPKLVKSPLKSKTDLLPFLIDIIEGFFLPPWQAQHLLDECAIHGSES